MTFDAKKQFLRHNREAAELLRATVPEPRFQQGIMAALAEMSARDVTAEQMSGAHIFIEILSNIGEPETKRETLPVRRLETFEPGYVPKSKEPK